jgi:LysR family glycine cleavage system transcriptional activator
VVSIFDRIESATYDVRKDHKRHILRVRAMQSFAIRWLIPRLASFHALFPDIHVEVTTSFTSDVALALRQVDFVFILQRDNYENEVCQADPLFELELTPICHKSLLTDRQGPLEPSDILGYPLLSALSRPDDWHSWFRKFGGSEKSSVAGLSFGSSALACQAALSGLGFAIAQIHFIQDYLHSGSVIRPFPESVRTGEMYQLIGSRGRAHAPWIAAFREWVLQEARSGVGVNVAPEALHWGGRTAVQRVEAGD